MNEGQKMWFTNTKMVNAVNLCMEVLCKAGLTESEAEYLPSCLSQAIKASNQISAKKTVFSPAVLEVRGVNGGYDITPHELETLLFQ